MGGYCSVDDLVTGTLSLDDACAFIRDADAILITVGAGMGVDSGLGTWRGASKAALPGCDAMGLGFEIMSRPSWFEDDPRLAWAYWKRRYQAYKVAVPHDGYSILAKLGARMPHGFFVVTSNIDGHWRRTPGVYQSQCWEEHGSLEYLQGSSSCEADLHLTDEALLEGLEVPDWDVLPGETVEVQLACQASRSDDDYSSYVFDADAEWVRAVIGEDGSSIRTTDGLEVRVRALRKIGGPDLMRVAEDCPLPRSPDGSVSRPAIKMFEDSTVNLSHSNHQMQCYYAWLETIPDSAKLAIIEVGAGVTITSIRDRSQSVATDYNNSVLLRINLDHSGVPPAISSRACSITCGALQAIRQIDTRVRATDA